MMRAVIKCARVILLRQGSSAFTDFYIMDWYSFKECLHPTISHILGLEANKYTDVWVRF